MPNDREGRGSVESPDLAELIRYLAVNLVDRPDEVRVELVEERTANVYELEVAEADLGKVIGRGGKTALKDASAVEHGVSTFTQ